MPKSSSNKQNISTNRTNTSINKNHPSYQSISKDYRPTIRVGYSVTKPETNNINTKQQKKTIMSSRMDRNSLMNGIVTKTCRRMVQPHYQNNQQKGKNQCKRKLGASRELKSGVFFNSQYVKGNNNSTNQIYHKKNVKECHERYQSGQAVKDNIQNQFVSIHKSRQKRVGSASSLYSSKTSRRTLPSYQNVGIKDVMEYHHAGQYRDTKVADKCTNASALSRFFKYEQINEYDFRKKPEFLRS